MLDQAVQDFGKRLGGTTLKQCRVGRNIIDVETAHEMVRIQQDAQGGITLAGWRKSSSHHELNKTHELLTGIWTPNGGWRCSVVTVQRAVFNGLKSTLPRGA